MPSGTRNQSTIRPIQPGASAVGTLPGSRSALRNRQNGMKRSRKATAMRYSAALVEAMVRRSCGIMAPSPPSGDFPVLRVLPEHGHAVHDPAEGEEPEGDDGEGSEDLDPAGDIPVRDVPVEGDERNVQPVENDPKDAARRRGPDEPPIPLPDPVGEEEAGQEDEPDRLHQEPAAQGGVQEVPVASVGAAEQLQEEVGEGGNGRGR